MTEYSISDISVLGSIILNDNSNIIKFCKEFKLDINSLNFRHEFYKQYDTYRDLYYKDTYLGSNHYVEYIDNGDYVYEDFKRSLIFIFLKDNFHRFGNSIPHNKILEFKVICKLKGKCNV